MEGRGRHHFAALKGASAALDPWDFERVVARDGIEPPTPAFSGPRSTTELSGLSANFGCTSTRGIRRRRNRWASPRTVQQQLDQYINSLSLRQTARS